MDQHKLQSSNKNLVLNLISFFQKLYIFEIYSIQEFETLIVKQVATPLEE